MMSDKRLAEIKARCEAYGVEVKALLAENERLRRDNGSLAKGYAEQLGDRQENIMLRAEVERLRAENANLKRLLDDANERAAQIEDWQIKCALLEVDRDKARAENAALAGERRAVEKLLLDNGYGGAGFASLADAIDATLGELRRLERIVGVPQPECVPWERRVEEVLTRAEAAEAERDRLREALEDIASREWEYFEDSSKPRGVGDAYCTRCLSTGPTVAGIVHADDCPFAALKEPTDAD